MIPKEAQRVMLAAACAYEAVALYNSATPTISSMCWRFKFPIPIVVAGLTYHLLSPPDKYKKKKL